MANCATGVRVLFFGAHLQPSFVVENCPIPKENELKDGEILIKLLTSTICSKDISNIGGKCDLKLPCVLGHEGIGEIILSKRNENASLAIGDRIVFSTNDSCGSCSMCQSEIPECCSSSNTYGSTFLRDVRGLNGTFATHMVVNKGTHVVKVPPNVSNAIASPVNCALATMVHVVSFVTFVSKLKQSVAIIQGANLMGLYGCALLKDAGFKKVYCHDISNERLRLVQKFGGIPVLVDKEYEFCNGHESEEMVTDVVIDVCGNWDVVPYALQALRHRGIYLFVGTSDNNRSSELCIDTILKKCITIRGIQGYSSSHLQKAVDFLSKTVNDYPYETLISPPLPLQELHSALAKVKMRNYYRIAIKPQLFTPG